MANFHTIRQAAAAALALPKEGLHLVAVRIGQAPGNTPGAISYLYDGTSNAVFPTAGTAVATSEDGVASYPLNAGPYGLSVPAAAFAWTGTVTWVEWIFSDAPNPDGARLEDHRAIIFRRVDGGPVTAAITVNYDAGESVPTAMLAFATPATRGRFQYPPVGAFQAQQECVAPRHFRLGPGNASGPIVVHPSPEVPSGPSLTLTGISDAATTIMAVVYYRPKNAK